MEKHTIYHSFFYRVIVIGCAVVSLYGLFTEKSAFELIMYSALLLSCILYYYSIKTDSKIVEWIVLIIQITIAILAFICK
jgi:Ca2+/Na+ antiporter